MCFTTPRYQVSVYKTIGPLVFSMASVAEWPPFEKLPLTQLTICSLCILTICKIISSPELKAHKVSLWYTSRAGVCPSDSVSTLSNMNISATSGLIAIKF